MKISVVSAEWEWGCCGDRFAVGDTVTWQLWASDPAGSDTAPFRESHHHDGPVAGVEVTGRVASIAAVTLVRTPTPGAPRHLILGGAASSEDVDSIREVRADEFVIRLEVDDATVLPEYREDPSLIAYLEGEAAKVVESRARMGDEVGIRLEALADEATARFAAVAEIRRSDERSAISIIPFAPDAAELHWLRGDATDESRGEILIAAGAGEWSFPASMKSAEIVAAFLEAVSAGDIREVIEHNATTPSVSTTEVSAGSAVWRKGTRVAPLGEGVTWMSGSELERLRRGNHNYSPWL